nr:PREDICTED: uncharacterized protein LOC109038796 isoform X2 [Bemisia tabaci]
MRTIAIDSGVSSATLLFAVCAIYRGHANPSDTSDTAPTLQETKTTRNGDICKPREELTADLLRHKIIPDFINDAPSIVCTVEWVERHSADLGNLIPNDVADFHPYWVYYGGNETEWHTLIVAGLDEPSYKEPILREYLHWLVVNVPGNNYHKGQELAFYKGPEPAKDTGIHRHGIVVYKQPEKLTFTEKRIKSPIKLEGILFVDMPQKPWIGRHDGSLYLALYIFISAPLFVSNDEVAVTDHPLNYSPKKIKAALEEHKIIPDALDIAPEKGILLEWFEGPMAVFGNILEPLNVLREPDWVKWDADESTYFTIMMIGLDEPTKENHTLREWQFWLVGNIPEYSIRFGDVMTYYLPPKPPKGSGIHRYVVLLYLQPNGSKIEFEEKKNPIFDIRDDKARGKWSHKKFAAKYKLGDPIACNFFRVRWVKSLEDNDTHVV